MFAARLFKALVLTTTVVMSGCAGETTKHTAPTSAATAAHRPAGSVAQQPAATSVTVAAADRPNSDREKTEFPKVGLAIELPPRFERATLFLGAGEESTQSSIVLNRLSGPVDQFLGGMTPERARTEGMTLTKGTVLDEKDLAFAKGRKAKLFEATQTAPTGLKIKKFMLAIGDAFETYLVVANYPATTTKERVLEIRAAVLSITPIDSQAPTADNMGFNVTAKDDLKKFPNTSMATPMILFARQFPDKDPRAPVFIVTRSYGASPNMTHKEFARFRATKPRNVQVVGELTMKEVTIDKLGGFETTFDAVDPRTNTKLAVIEVILFDDKAAKPSYFLMFGKVERSDRKRYENTFKQMTRTFRHTISI